MTTTVQESNLVAIPHEIASAFHIYEGTKLEWSQAGDGVIAIKPLFERGDLARKLMGAGRRLVKAGHDPVADLIRDRELDDKMDQADEVR